MATIEKIRSNYRRFSSLVDISNVALTELHYERTRLAEDEIIRYLTILVVSSTALSEIGIQVGSNIEYKNEPVQFLYFEEDGRKYKFQATIKTQAGEEMSVDVDKHLTYQGKTLMSIVASRLSRHHLKTEVYDKVK